MPCISLLEHVARSFMCAQTVITIFPTVKYFSAPSCSTSNNICRPTFFIYIVICFWSPFVCQKYFNIVYILHIVTPLFLRSTMLIWCFVFFCDEKPFIKWVSCMPVALMGVSCAQRKRGCDYEHFNGNKQKELKNIKTGLHMKCWNPYVLYKRVLFVCSRAWAGWWE